MIFIQFDNFLGGFVDEGEKGCKVTDFFVAVVSRWI